jgi:hypothetical protein
MGGAYVRCIQSGRELTLTSAAALEEAWRTQPSDNLSQLSTKQPALASLSEPETKPKRKLTIFSWGYWGWGSSAAQFVKAADAVEAARGYEPPLFVDVRLQRSVRAANFNGSTFKELVGEKRYRWMNKLGNMAIADRSLKKLTIKDPHEAETLLDLALECEKENRRLLFFCACPVPKECHRYEVGRLILKAAKRRGINAEVVEWPGGEPQDLQERCSEDILKRMQKGVQMFPLSAEPDLVKYGGLPWGSVVEVTGGSERLSFISGPAIYKKDNWGLPVVFYYDRFDDPSQARELALPERSARGYDPRTSMK